MNPVAAAEATVLLQFEPFGRFLLVFLRVVVPALALGARHHHHHAILFLWHLSPLIAGQH
jgi:hypothetical protein